MKNEIKPIRKCVNRLAYKMSLIYSILIANKILSIGGLTLTNIYITKAAFTGDRFDF